MTYIGPDGKKIKVAGLSDEDRLTLVRWIDLGCPIDLDYDPARPEATGFGWMLDDQRPTLTSDLASRGCQPAAGPHPGRHVRLRRARSGQLPGRREFPGRWCRRGGEPGEQLPLDFPGSLGAEAQAAGVGARRQAHGVGERSAGERNPDRANILRARDGSP